MQFLVYVVLTVGWVASVGSAGSHSGGGSSSHDNDVIMLDHQEQHSNDVILLERQEHSRHAHHGSGGGAGGHHTPREQHQAPREHQVHNLVLNPDQHSWCELKHIRQIVTHAHCTSKEMENYVCVGTCFSYTVPQTEPETPGDELLDYCDSCQASESHWTEVTLDCDADGTQYQVTKNIQMITNCSCSPCPPRKPAFLSNEVTSHHSDHHISELLLKMLPDNRKVNDVQKTDLTKELEYTQVSIGDLKKEINLDAAHMKLLNGKVVFKDDNSFHDYEDENNPRHHSY